MKSSGILTDVNPQHYCQEAYQMTKPKILVTSATGKTGSAAVRQLLEKEYPVRAFVHRKDHRSDTL